MKNTLLKKLLHIKKHKHDIAVSSERSAKNHKEACQGSLLKSNKVYESFLAERRKKEHELSENLIGNVLSLTDIDTINKKFSELERKESTLLEAIKKSATALEESEKALYKSIIYRRKTARNVEKYHSLNSREKALKTLKQQYQQDCEMDEFNLQRY